MALIKINPAYDEATATAANTETLIKKGLYLFDDESGQDPVELIVWLEKSKANKTNPDGKHWIKLPKNNVTNRSFFSEDLFIKEAVNGSVNVAVKTAAPRILGKSGIKQDIAKYLGKIENDVFVADEALVKEYTDLVSKTVELFKATKGTGKKKKPEEMNIEELEAYVIALKTGTKMEAANGDAKSFMDMFTDAEYARYNEILAISAENRANAPKTKKGPLSDAEKAIRSEKRKANELTKAEQVLAALKSKQTGAFATAVAVDEDPIDEDEVDDEDLIDEDELDDDDTI